MFLFFCERSKIIPKRPLTKTSNVLNITLNNPCKDVQNFRWFAISHKEGKKDIITKMKGFEGRNGIIRWNQWRRKINIGHDMKLLYAKDTTNLYHVQQIKRVLIFYAICISLGMWW